MSNPYVTWEPSEVGPCTATWLVAGNSGNPENDGPAFGPGPFISQPVGAWDYLVDGPLKAVLDRTYNSYDEMLGAWASAGGQLNCTVQDANGQPVGLDRTPWAQRVDATSGAPAPTGAPAPFVWFFSADTSTSPAYPLRWTVKFSVPHSIIK